MAAAFEMGPTEVGVVVSWSGSCGRCYWVPTGSNFGGHFIVGTKRTLRLDLNAMNDTVEGEWRAVGIGDAGGLPMSIPMEPIMTGT